MAEMFSKEAEYFCVTWSPPICTRDSSIEHIGAGNIECDAHSYPDASVLEGQQVGCEWVAYEKTPFHVGFLPGQSARAKELQNAICTWLVYVAACAERVSISADLHLCSLVDCVAHRS